MKTLRAEIGRRFGKRYVWTRDFEGDVKLHRNRGGWCYVFDFTHIGKFLLKKDGSTRNSSLDMEHYTQRWYDYEKYRDKSSLNA